MRVKDIEFVSANHVIQEIKDMNVKGGSPFGRASAWAYKLAIQQERLTDLEAVFKRFAELSDQMHVLKPTMGTIHNTSSIVHGYLEKNADLPFDRLCKGIVRLCDNIIESSFKAVEVLSRYGGARVPDGGTVMMHSYSSTLMGCFASAAEAGKQFRVICTESRPLRESRLAVDMLHKTGVKVTYITDAEVFEFLPAADMVLMGADSLSSDGSVANKMGTALIARLAKGLKIPVYIASELYKYDTRTREGRPIELERRSAFEIISEGDFACGDPEVINQFFDLTPATDITALICEYGLIPTTLVASYWETLINELMDGVERA